MTFEAGPANPQPFSLGIHVQPPFDPLAWLPTGAADKLRALRQAFSDAHALIPPFEDLREARAAVVAVQQNLERHLAPRSTNGFALADDGSDGRVVALRQELERLEAEDRRLNERSDERTARWHERGFVLQAVETWLKSGRPPGTVLADYDGPEPQLLKGENGSLDAIANRRRRVRELRADLHTIKSKPFPSSYCKQRMREQIGAIAAGGGPSVSDLVENDRAITWPTRNVQSSVYNVEGPAIAFAEVSDAVALVAWLHKDTLIAKLAAEIDAEADDTAALTHEQRQRAEAETLGDLLSVERDEAWFVWKAMDERLPVEHRADCSPEAILGCRSVVAPALNPSPGSTPGTSWTRR